MRWSIMLVGLVMVIAGCSAFSPLVDGGSNSTTVTPAPVPSVTETPTPQPGSRTDRTARAQELLDEIPANHIAALENRSYTLRERYEYMRIGENTATLRYRTRKTRVESNDTYRTDTRVRQFTMPERGVGVFLNNPSALPVVFERTVYADDGRQYVRVKQDGVNFSRDTAQSADAYAIRVVRILENYLSIQVTTARTVRQNGTRLTYIAGHRNVSTMYPTDTEWRSYRTEVYITRGGLIKRAVVTFTSPETKSVWARLSFRYESVDNTSVPEPVFHTPPQSPSEKHHRTTVLRPS